MNDIFYWIVIIIIIAPAIYQYVKYKKKVKFLNISVDEIDNYLAARQTYIDEVAQRQKEKTDIERQLEESKAAYLECRNRLCEYQNLIEQESQKFIEIQSQTEEAENELLIAQEEYNSLSYLSQVLLDFEKRQQIYVEALQKEEHLKLDSARYQILLTEDELQIINIVLELKKKIPESDILNKLIWSTFYQKKIDELVKRVLPINGKATEAVCGIYKITNKENGKAYVGQAVDIRKRWIEHIKCFLDVSRGGSPLLTKELKEYGINSFTFELVEGCSSKEELNEREKYWITFFKTNEFGLNMKIG